MMGLSLSSHSGERFSSSMASSPTATGEAVMNTAPRMRARIVDLMFAIVFQNRENFTDD